MSEPKMRKIEKGDLASQSADVIADNIALLGQMFPELVTESATGAVINVDVLKQLVGDQSVTDAAEKFGLGWHGKRAARQFALAPSTGTLRPCPEESVDWDTTQNLMIEGDNLEVLKLLQKSYAGKVKLIYIDPPYNTGKDFVYPDDYRDTIRNYLEVTGQVDGEGRKRYTNSETSGRFHTDWLNMMYPRLKLARQLLREDGVMFVSIDDSEAGSLRAVCDEVFGHENFVCTVVWQKKYAKQNDSKTLSVSHDYLLLYTKRIDAWIPGELLRDEAQLKGYKNPDGDRRGRWQSVVYTCNKSRAERPNLYYPIRNPFTGKDAWPDESRVWAYEATRTESNIKEGRLWWGANGELEKPRMKSFLAEVGAGIVPDTLWFREDVGDTQDSAREVAGLLGASVFDTPKPVRLLRRCIDVAKVGPSDLVVDFFAGSATTGHAVFAASSDNKTTPRFILVQLPESLDPASREQAVSASFCDQLSVPRNIAEITKERLRRAGAKLRAEHPMFAGDLGFRVFKLDSSNVREWDGAAANLQAELDEAVDNIKQGRSDADLLYELLLKLGLDLCVPIETRTFAERRVYSVGAGTLFACLAWPITREAVEPVALGITAWRKELGAAGNFTCVFRDSAFVDDVAKTNMVTTLTQLFDNVTLRSI